MIQTGNINFLVNDTLDDILNESGDEEESDAIVTQVLDEIGIDISGKVLVCIYFIAARLIVRCTVVLLHGT